MRRAIWKVRKKLLKLAAQRMPGYRLRRRLLLWAGYTIGKDAFIGEGLLIIDELEDRHRVTIGARAAIAPRVTLVVSSTPNLSRIGPYVKCVHGHIAIGDDAWLGTGSIVLPDVTIGTGAVVGAGAVVTKDVPDYTVVAGVPAAPVKMLHIPDSGKA